MNEHVNGWLTAYFDDELGELRSQKVQAHLKECEGCREELAALSSLRQLLGDNPEASDLLPANLFASQVALRLTRRPSHPFMQRAITVAWGSIPAVLLAIWVFIQTLFILTSMGRIAMDLGLWSDLPSGLSLAVSNSPANALMWNLGLSTLIGLAILSWLASWWIRQQDSMTRQVTE
jgi:predicted anti-sigma-YlaC factor YlaD